MDNQANLAYLTAIINSYERQINKATTATIKSTVLKEVVGTLGDLESFMADRKATESKTTLDVNAELIEKARAYKSELAVREATITDLSHEIYAIGYKIDAQEQLERENKLLEADNLKLKAENQILKNTTGTWAVLYNDLLNDLKKAKKSNWIDNI